MGYKIEFILYPGALGIDITGPLEVFNTAVMVMAHRYKLHAAYSYQFTAPQIGPVSLNSGLQLMADTDFSTSSPADIIIVPGGEKIDTMLHNTTFIHYIQKQAQKAKRIISVCKGSFILAEAGLLNNKTATTHWIAADEMAAQYPEVTLNADAIFVKEDNIFTSAGGTAGIDLSLAIVEEDYGTDVALEVSRLMVLYFKRPGSQSQFSIPLKTQAKAGKQFLSLHDWLLNNMNKSIRVEQMADVAAMSPRNFARIFQKQTGMTPARYLETIRLEQARKILESGSESISEIARITGFAREERLRRAFHRHFGITPAQYRMHFLHTKSHNNSIKNVTEDI